jgi:hypothetical protein
MERPGSERRGKGFIAIAAGLGIAGYGRSGQVVARPGFHLSSMHGRAGPGIARRVWAGRRRARHGPTGQGQALHGTHVTSAAFTARRGPSGRGGSGPGRSLLGGALRGKGFSVSRQGAEMRVMARRGLAARV